MHSTSALKSRWFLPSLYLAAITGAEIVTVFSRPVLGVIFHVALLTALLVHGALRFRQPGSRLLLGLTLAPITRILSLAMPLQTFPQVLWFPMIYGPLLAATVVTIVTLRLSRSDIGFVRGKIPFQMLIILSGPFLGTVEYLILAPAGLVAPPFTLQKALLPSFIMIATAGFVEELIFRGVLEKLSQDTLGSWG